MKDLKNSCAGYDDMKKKSKTRPKRTNKRATHLSDPHRQSNLKHHEILDNINDGVYELDTNGCFTFVNKAIVERSGIQLEQFRRLHFLDIVDPEYHDLAKQNFQRVMEGENGRPYELSYRDAKGKARIVEVSSGPIFEGEAVVGLLGISRDVTERRRVEEALKKSEEKYRAILENASDAILLTDKEGHLLEANRKAQEFFGYQREELLQMHYTELHPMNELGRTIEAFKNIVSSGHGFLHNGSVVRKNGQIVRVDITGSVIEYSGGKVIQGSFRDITDTAHAHEILERIVKERTAELSEKNKLLVHEIGDHKRDKASLRKKTNALQLHSNKLKELNTALKVLLRQREEDRTDLEEKVLTNVKHLLAPHMETLKKKKLDREVMTIVEILESNLKKIISPFSRKLSSKDLSLTPAEINVANLIREGKSTKEIAQFMMVSVNAVNHHRHHIRGKLGILTQKANLRSYLSTLP